MNLTRLSEQRSKDASWKERLYTEAEGLISTLKNKWHNTYWWVMHRAHPKHRYHMVNTGLEPGYYDPDMRIMHGMFNTFKKYYEDMVEQDCIDWDSDEGHRDTWEKMEKLYSWWVYIRPYREDNWRHSNSEPDADREFFEVKDGVFQMTPCIPDRSSWLQRLMDKEEEWDKEDKEMMKILVDIHTYLWYP